MDVKFILNKIKLEQNIYSDAELANLLKVSPSAVSNWKSRGNMPLTTLRKYCYSWEKSIDEYLENNVLNVYTKKNIDIKHKDIKLKGDIEDMDSQYIIDLQKDKIEQQKLEIKTLKDTLQEKQAESVHWEELPYDFISSVTLKRKGLKFGRTVDSITEIERQSEILGYSISELEKYWSVGTFYKFNEHPIDNIIAKESLKEIDKKLRTLPYMFDSIKSIVGEHYIPQPLMYIAKNEEVVCAVAYAKVEWRTLRVTAKVQYLIHMPLV